MELLTVILVLFAVKKYNMEEFLEICETEKIPHCSKCGGIIKPDVTLYEEVPDPDTFRKAINEISKADTLIIGGTSLIVYPAASLIHYFQGKNLVLIINPRPSRTLLQI